MIFVKYTFLFFIFVGASIIGNLFSRKYKNRVIELKSFKEACNILESKIKFTYKPLGEIYEEISTMVEKNSIYRIFKDTTKNLKNENFKNAWEKAIIESKSNLNLNSEDIEIITSLGNMLRKN